MNRNYPASANKTERRDLILETLRRNGRIVVTDLASRTGISAVTIRKDLAALERERLLDRVYGGAVSPAVSNNDHNYSERRNFKKAEKQAIARAVADLVHDGESIMINVGTTSEYVVEQLKGKHNLAVITNALPILERLCGCENITTFFLGGTFQSGMQITIGDSVIEQLSRYTVDKLIMGMDGVDPVNGLTSRNHVEDYVMHKMISRSREKILVVDDSKIGRSSLVHIADISTFDTLVTNRCPENDSILKQIESKGIRIVIAD